MIQIHLLQVEHSPEVFAPLIEAAGEIDLRVGWLDLTGPLEVPEKLEEAAGLGVLRAVRAVRAVGASAGRSVAVKPVAGDFILSDLLREHFAGCALVLVHGEVKAPSIEPVAEDRWKITAPSGEGLEYSTRQLAEALRRPQFLDLAG